MLINGFQFAENSGDEPSPIELWAADSARAFRNFYVLNASQLRRLQAAKALLGYGKTKLDSATGRTYLSRRLPAAYPAVADPETNPKALPYQWARSISRGEPVGASTGLSAQGASEYPAYKMGVEFSALPFLIREDDQVLAQQGPLAADPETGARALPDEGDSLRRGLLNSRWVSRFIEEGVLTLVIREGVMKFKKKGKNNKDYVLPKGFPFNELRATVRYIHHELPEDAVPRDAIAAAVATVNDADFDSFRAGTLLFKSMSDRLMQAPFGGQRLWEVQFVFSWVPSLQTFAEPGQPKEQLGHNAMIRSRDDLEPSDPLQGLAYEEVVDKVKERNVYQKSSFPDLFRPDQ